MGWLLLHRNAAQQNIRLTKNEITIGRSKDSFCIIKTPFLSRRHVYMKLNGEFWIIKDLSSSNGVYIGDKQIPANEEVVLKEGDKVGFGMPCSFYHSEFDAVYTLVKVLVMNEIEVEIERNPESLESCTNDSQLEVKSNMNESNAELPLEEMDCSKKSVEKHTSSVETATFVLNASSPISEVPRINKRRYFKIKKVVLSPVKEVDLTTSENANVSKETTQCSAVNVVGDGSFNLEAHSVDQPMLDARLANDKSNFLMMDNDSDPSTEIDLTTCLNPNIPESETLSIESRNTRLLRVNDTEANRDLKKRKSVVVESTTLVNDAEDNTYDNSDCEILEAHCSENNGRTRAHVYVDLNMSKDPRLSKRVIVNIREVERPFASRFIWDILQWNAAWLEEQKQYDVPPKITNCENKVELSYQTAKLYGDTYGSLVKYECWEKVTNDYTQNTCPIILNIFVKDVKYTANDEKRVSTLISVYGRTRRIITTKLNGWLGILSELSKNELPTNFKNRFCFVESCDVCDTDQLNNRTDLPLKFTQDFETPNTSVFDMTIRVKMVNTDLFKNCTLCLQMLSNITIDASLFEITNEIFKTSWSELLLNPLSILIKSPDKPLLCNSDFDPQSLSTCQAEIVLKMSEMACNSSSDPQILLIDGFPGTGKTTTIIYGIQELLKMNTSTSFKILVLTSSKGGLNEMMLRLIDLKSDLKNSGIKMRLVLFSNENSCTNMKIHDYTIERHVEKKRSKLDANEIWPGDSEVQQQIFRAADVITSTIENCSMPEMKFLQSLENVICMIDEASQMIEPETLLPLQHGINKLILVGDHKHLNNNVKSQTAFKRGYHISLFDRLHSIFRRQREIPIITLKEQYRMHPELFSFPFHAFYNTEVKSTKFVNFEKKFPFINYCVFNVCDGQELVTSQDYYNQNEVEFVMKLCETILNKSLVNIAVLTFSSSQQQALQERKMEIFSDENKYVEVSTVDLFRGREKDCVILNTVRTNPRDKIGASKNCDLLKIALTRACTALYIVGHVQTLKTYGPKWRELILDAENRGVNKIVDTFYSNHQIADCIYTENQ